MDNYIKKFKEFFQYTFLYFLISFDIALVSFTINSCKKTINYMVNDFIKSISYHGDNELTDDFVDAVLDNKLLDFDSKMKVLDAIDYIDENQFLEDDILSKYGNLYILYSKVDEYPSDEDSYILGEYKRELNSIVIYDKQDDDYEQTLMHELTHVSGHLDSRFLNEGITSLITAEYYNDGQYNTYKMEVNFVKILMELIGRDAILEAYTTSNINIIYEALADIEFDVNTAKNYISQIDRFCDDVYEIDDIESLIKPIIYITMDYGNKIDPNTETDMMENIYQYLQDINGNVYIKDYINIDRRVKSLGKINN